MSIEFRCSQCNRLLRTGDDTAGKQAQCPECQAITTIPGATVAAVVPEPPRASEPPEPQASAAEQQPSASPTQPSPGGCNHEAMARELARVQIAARMAVPALATLFFAVFGIVSQIVFFWKLGMGGPDAVVPLQFKKLPEFAAVPKETLVACLIIAGIIGLIVNVLMLIGGLNMRNLGSYALALMGAIIGLIPCMSPCCPFPLPFAIWALIVLYDPAVRAAFRR